MRSAAVVCLLGVAMCCAPRGWALDVVHYIVSHHERPYFREVLTLALEKSRARYGDYRVETSSEMVIERALRRLAERKRPYSVRMLLPQEKVNAVTEIKPIPFPLLLGTVGYRVCFHRADLATRVASLEDLDALRQLSIVQGKEWVDAYILRSNGFRVVEIGSQELGLPRTIQSMYQRVAKGDFDVFCRGISELISERHHYADLPQLVLDESMALYYPLPFFFYLNRQDTQLAERIFYGLSEAFHDGSFHRLWHAETSASIAVAKLHQRKIFTLENPYVQSVDPTFLRFVYQPSSQAHVETQ